MTTSRQIRDWVVQALQRATKRIFDPIELEETILIRDGHYRGRSYRYDSWLAMWIIEAGCVQIYTPDGELADLLTLDPPAVPVRRAA